MSPVIGIISDTPTYSRGLTALLAEGGFTPVNLNPDSVPGKTKGLAAVVFDATHQGRQRLIRRISSHAPVVAMVSSAEELEFRRALRLGAHSVLSANCTTETVIRSVAAAASQESLLPYDLVQSILGSISEETEAPPLDPPQILWLGQLAEGLPIAKIAARAGYSEREMFRRLTSLYNRMGVVNRYQAIALAAIRGLLPPDDRRGSPADVVESRRPRGQP